MATDNQHSIDRELLTQRMNSLAREIVGLKPDDPRRAEIVKEKKQGLIYCGLYADSFRPSGVILVAANSDAPCILNFH